MAYEVPIEFVGGQVKAACSICGVPYRFPAEFVRGPDGLWRCPRCGPEETAIERDRIMAASRRRREMPPPPTFVPIQWSDDLEDVEDIVLGAVLRIAPYAYENVTSGAGQLSAATSALGAGEAVRYLYDLITEGRRPAAMLAQARAKLISLADWLVSSQRVLTGVNVGWPDHGSWRENNTSLAGTASAAGLALCRAYQLTNDGKYIDAAMRAALFLRRMQCAAYRDVGFASSDDAGTVPWYCGMWAHSTVPGTSNLFYDNNYYAGDLSGIEFLTALMGIVGDINIGDSVPPWTFTRATAAPISQMIADAIAFWTNGVSGVTGLSASTPYEYFNGYPRAKAEGRIPSGTHTWQYATGTSISGRNWALALRSLKTVEGISARVSALYAHLLSYAADPATDLPAGYSDKQTADCALGPFSPRVCLPTLLDTVSKANGSQTYDWACAGLLAPIQAALDGLSFQVTQQAGRWRLRYPAELTDPTTLRRDSLFLREYSGLSLQLSGAGSHGVIANDLFAAAACGSILRQPPQGY